MSYVRLTFGVEWWEEIWGLQWQGGRRCFPWWSWQIFRFSMKILRSRPVSQTGTSSSLHSFQRRWNSLLVVHFFFSFFFFLLIIQKSVEHLVPSDTTRYEIDFYNAIRDEKKPSFVYGNPFESRTKNFVTSLDVSLTFVNLIRYGVYLWRWVSFYVKK